MIVFDASMSRPLTHKANALVTTSDSAYRSKLTRQLDEWEQKIEVLALSHDTFSRNARVQFKQVFDAIRDLMAPPEPPKRPIGFVTQEDKGKKG